jgi:quercetin dioxygenase-like cupin family protein
MTDLNMELDDKGRFIPESEQTAVWLMGGLAQVRVPGDATRNSFTVVQHTGLRGYTTPQHVHHFEDEVFVVLDGELKMVCDGKEQIAQAGDTMIIPRTIPHGFVATSDIKFLTIHSTPREGERPQFDIFLDAEIPHAKALTLPTEEFPYGLDHIVKLGETYGYGYAGPAPTL